MADIQKIISGIVVTVAGQAFKTYMERPATLTADVLAVPYAAPAGQAPTNASCLLAVKITNDTPKPARQIQIIADYTVAYATVAPKKPIVTGSIAKDVPYVIDVLNPGASRRVFLFTSYPCDDLEMAFGHPGMRVFNDEGSATVRTIVPPSGWMLIYANEYYFVSLPLMGAGIFLFLLIIIGGIVDGIKKMAPAAPTTPSTPAS